MANRLGILVWLLFGVVVGAVWSGQVNAATVRVEFTFVGGSVNGSQWAAVYNGPTLVAWSGYGNGEGWVWEGDASLISKAVGDNGTGAQRTAICAATGWGGCRKWYYYNPGGASACGTGSVLYYIPGDLTCGEAPEPDPWKLNVLLSNASQLERDYAFALWDDGGSQWTYDPAWLFTLQPGTSRASLFEFDEAQNIGVGRVEAAADGSDIFTVLATWSDASSAWEQTSGVPDLVTIMDDGQAWTPAPAGTFQSGSPAGTLTQTNSTATFAVGLPVRDTTSQNVASRSIDFSTSTNSTTAAKEETIQTGFSSLRQASMEGTRGVVTAVQGSSASVAAAIAAGTAATESVGNSVDEAVDGIDEGNALLTQIVTNTAGLRATVDTATIASDATSSGTSASSSVRADLSALESSIAGIGGSGTVPAHADVWAFTFQGKTIDLNPFNTVGISPVAAFIRYFVGWAAAVGMVWWAWRETFKTWIFATVVPQAGAASSVPVVSTGSAAVMAGVISVSMLAIPTVFLTWYSVGLYPGQILVNPFNEVGTGTDAQAWMSRFLYAADRCIPFTLLFGQIILRFVYHLSLAGAYALASTIIKFAVG